MDRLKDLWLYTADIHIGAFISIACFFVLLYFCSKIKQLAPDTSGKQKQPVPDIYMGEENEPSLNLQPIRYHTNFPTDATQSSECSGFYALRENYENAIKRQDITQNDIQNIQKILHN